MDYKRRIAGFQKRWNIDSDPNPEGGLTAFRNRVLTIVDSGPANFVLRNKLDEDFCFHLGIAREPTSAVGLFSDFAPKEQFFAGTAIFGALSKKKDDLVGFVYSLQVLLWILEEADYPEMAALASDLREAAEATPGIEIAVAQRGNGITLYPRGSKLLDDALVNESLEMLQDLPDAQRHFDKALGLRMAKEQHLYRNLLDELRKSLEELAKSLLKNRKSLENNRAGLLKWAKDNGAHPQVASLLSCLLSHYTQYQNDAVKHGEDWSHVEVDYMVYLTGSFMWLLLELHGSDAE